MSDTRADGPDMDPFGEDVIGEAPTGDSLVPGDSFVPGGMDDGANDLFVFGAGDGSDYFPGGEGWTDTVQEETFADVPADGGWVLEVDVGNANPDGSDGLAFGDGDMPGPSDGDDGTVLAFDNLDTIVW